MNTKRRGLGRGLDALLGAEPEKRAEADSVSAGVAEVSVERLEPNRFQPRSTFDESGLEELAKSIQDQGLVQPIVVTPNEHGRFTIIAGERRWRAAQRAGLKSVPVVVREVADDQQMLELALVENVQRADLNVIEEAEAYRMLTERFELSQEEVASKVGKGRTTITNALRLLRLPEEVQDFLRDGRITAGQARPILSIQDRSQQIKLADRVIEEGLTARDLEALVAAPKPKQQKKPKTQELDVHTQAAMERLTRDLQTKVEILRRKRGGMLKIHFHSEEELIRLYDRLMQGKDDV